MTIIIPILGCLCFVGLFLYSKRNYQEECSKLKDESKLWRFMNMGLFLLDYFPIHRREAKINYRLLDLYGKKEYGKRIRIYEGERRTIGILFVFGGFLLALLAGISSLRAGQIEEIKRKSFGEGDRVYQYFYHIKDEDGEESDSALEQITVTIPQMNPTQDEITLELENIKRELKTFILGENRSFDYVDQPLVLPDELGPDVKLIWTSENEQLLLRSGDIRYRNLEREGEKVILKVTIFYFDRVVHEEYEIALYQRTPSKQEEKEAFQRELKQAVSREELQRQEGEKVTLPKEFGEYGYTLEWFQGEKNTNNLAIILGGIAIGGCFYFLKEAELKEKVRRREQDLLREFPGCVNKITLLMNAGMTLKRAWDKILADYMRVKEVTGKSILLYEEMLLTKEDLCKGVLEIKAFEDFGHRCKLPEILRFTSIIIQNIRKGSDLFVLAMEQQGKEAYALKVDSARKKGEKASTQLVLPMGILFLAILIIVITPALITLQI